MDPKTRIEKALENAVSRTEAKGGPPRLAAAIRHAVFPTGALVRPRLCLAVAGACGAEEAVATAAATAIELLHCASLVHDDLPCFDDAATRRGKPSVHAAFGAPLAVLAGDAMIVLAFETLARGLQGVPSRLAELVTIVAGAVGMPFGICAGQAWESEPEACLETYQQAKTGALFVAAAAAGAAAAGHQPREWVLFAERLGEAYQVADDIRDVACKPEEIGKPCGQDAQLGRPNAVAKRGVAGAVELLGQLVNGAAEAIPICPGRDKLRALVMKETRLIVPADLVARAA